MQGGITSFNTGDGRRNVVDDDISWVAVDLFPIESNEDLIQVINLVFELFEAFFAE
jgi:hypothetical protein